MSTKGLVEHDDGVVRCWWAADDAEYRRYHDEEWGRPAANDHRLFEKVCLEGFQSGLSWLTILRKRENFRRAFADFDFEKVARFNQRSVERLLRDKGIIRHRGKIEATINNARRAPEIRDEFGSLTDYFCRFAPTPGERPRRLDYASLMKLAQTPQSQALSKDLKSRGWKFVGPITMYALMQAMGLVNDHIEGCSVRAEAEQSRLALPLEFK